MKTTNTLFLQVGPFYRDMLSAIESARERISMMYFNFDLGDQGIRIAHLLAARAAAGVQVRVMLDELGQTFDAPRHIFANHRLVGWLRSRGVQVDLFRPAGWRLTQRNRLHCKICAVDGETLFIGGSNIGDHYLAWDDQNMRLDGPHGDVFHQIYDFILHQSAQGRSLPIPALDFSNLRTGTSRILLTVPKQRQDIRRSLLNLILDTDEALYIRTWYFLPDREILNALRSQARRGVEINVLLSHRTRVPLVDTANYIHGHKLARAGGRVFRFTGTYMHAKVAWNSRGQVLFGSANMDSQALGSSFECSLLFDDQDFAGRLTGAFEHDAARSFEQTPDIFRRRALPLKALSYACSMASPWL